VKRKNGEREREKKRNDLKSFAEKSFKKSERLEILHFCRRRGDARPRHWEGAAAFHGSFRGFFFSFGFYPKNCEIRLLSSSQTGVGVKFHT